MWSQREKQTPPPVFLLHGFPDFWYGWKAQIDYLAKAGYRVIVPDLRGYNLTEKPTKIEAYHIDILMADVISLIDHFGYERVYLAAHDWGAVLGWWLADKRPDRLHKLAILNVPYPTFAKVAWKQRIWPQLFRSWYIYFFQIPLLPELVLSWSGKSSRFNMLTKSSLPDTFTAEDVVHYQTAWAKPEAWTSMVNWYRAAFKTLAGGDYPEAGSIVVPTLILWGEQDIALDKRLAALSRDLCADGELIYYPHASHWLQHDETAEVNRQLNRFFSEE